MANIKLNGHYLASLDNKALVAELRQMIAETKRTVSHRRGIINGYHLVNIDSMLKDNTITEPERLAAYHILYRAYDIIDS